MVVPSEAYARQHVCVVSILTLVQNCSALLVFSHFLFVYRFDYFYRPRCFSHLKTPALVDVFLVPASAKSLFFMAASQTRPTQATDCAGIQPSTQHTNPRKYVSEIF